MEEENEKLLQDFISALVVDNMFTGENMQLNINCHDHQTTIPNQLHHLTNDHKPKRAFTQITGTF